MNEISMAFGPDRHLVGTLTMPSDAPPGKVAVLLTNAGVIHRMGPHRFNVKLARALACHGIPCFRVDISGQGDSRTPIQKESFERQAVIDLRTTMDHVQRICGIDQFVIAGICSGAHNGLATALEDERVVGLWMLDGYAYATPKTQKVRYVHQLKSRLLPTLGSWAQSAMREAGKRVKGMLESEDMPTPVVDYGQTTPSKQDFAAMMQTLVARNVNIYLVYSGSILWHYNYPEQLQDAFPGESFVRRVRCDYVPDVDHTATTLQAQHRLIHSITGWARETFASA